MEVEFRDKTLAFVETDQAAETKLPFAVINSLRQKLVVFGPPRTSGRFATGKACITKKWRARNDQYD